MTSTCGGSHVKLMIYSTNSDSKFEKHHAPIPASSCSYWQDQKGRYTYVCAAAERLFIFIDSADQLAIAAIAIARVSMTLWVSYIVYKKILCTCEYDLTY